LTGKPRRFALRFPSGERRWDMSYSNEEGANPRGVWDDRVVE